MTRAYDTSNRPRRSGKASGARGWYDSPEWRARSNAHLERNPYCVRCGDQASISDHITPVRVDDREGVLCGSIQSMCRPCKSLIPGDPRPVLRLLVGAPPCSGTAKERTAAVFAERHPGAAHALL